MTRFSFSLFLFSTDLMVIQKAVDSGVEGVVIDWEEKGKEARQAGVDTQINHDTLEDLIRVRKGTPARILCRINPVGPYTGQEVDAALQGGADEILLPMVRSTEQVHQVLDRIGGRRGLGILIETVEAVENIERFAKMPLSRIYVGFNDLMIDRGHTNLFSPLTDGTLERLRAPFQMPFGFGGLTLPEKGNPIPCRLLMAEMARLSCHFSFLRRSFFRDTQGGSMEREIPRILKSMREAFERTPQDTERDRNELIEKVRSIQ